LSDPPPAVTFAGFGDSTLNFEVRCFLPNAAVKLPTTHELHTNIDKAFREAGIEMAFPQCDLHIRTVDATFPFQQITHSTSGVRNQDTAFSKGA
jgi:potassium-dependent mechanosensitive channel